MQKIQIIGNLTKDIELKDINSKDKEYKFAILSVAVNGVSEKDTLFIDFEAWGKNAENSAKYLKKGSKVYIEGTMQNNVYEKDGVKHYGYKFRAESIEFLSVKTTEK